jgi:MFS transporter, putative metabolite:H+ symporter
MRSLDPSANPTRAARLIVLVAALGYFVDIYDLLLFGIVRIPSVLDIGGFASREAPGASEFVEREGIFLLNMQMLGLLTGGLLWGIMGDLRGRKAVLFGSILMYSLANLANGLVQTIPQYAILRFIAGVGLAGELGAGVTLVSETMDRERRGLGTMVIASFGMFGAVVAALVADAFPWRTAYFVGGGLGLLLLFLRVGVMESGMFETAQRTEVKRGAFHALFTDWGRLKRYIACVAVGFPIWFAIGIPVTLAPEVAAALGVVGEVSAGTAILWAYVGLAVGDVASGTISQFMRSRRKVMGLFILLLFALAAVYLNLRAPAPSTVYVCCFGFGLFAGYWAVFVTNASEQFGTNLRATVTTTAPNFVRGSAVLMTLSYLALHPSMGRPMAALVVCAVVTVLALVALAAIPERFDADLDYVEPL